MPKDYFDLPLKCSSKSNCLIKTFEVQTLIMSRSLQLAKALTHSPIICIFTRKRERAYRYLAMLCLSRSAFTISDSIRLFRHQVFSEREKEKRRISRFEIRTGSSAERIPIVGIQW